MTETITIPVAYIIIGFASFAAGVKVGSMLTSLGAQSATLLTPPERHKRKHRIQI